MIASLVLLLSLIHFSGPQEISHENCTVSEVAINSRVLQGQIILVDKGKSRAAAGAEVEFFVLRDGEWQRYSWVKAVNSEARFVLLEVNPGKYLLNAKIEGYPATRVYLNVRNGITKREVVIPLSNGRCGKAKLRKVK
jgi:hypothetical protein